MNKDFRHKKVKSTSPTWTWLEEMQRRVANATRRANHHRERRDAKREIQEAV